MVSHRTIMVHDAILNLIRRNLEKNNIHVPSRPNTSHIRLNRPLPHIYRRRHNHNTYDRSTTTHPHSKPIHTNQRNIKRKKKEGKNMSKDLSEMSVGELLKEFANEIKKQTKREIIKQIKKLEKRIEKLEKKINQVIKCS